MFGPQPTASFQRSEPRRPAYDFVEFFHETTRLQRPTSLQQLPVRDAYSSIHSTNERLISIPRSRQTPSIRSIHYWRWCEKVGAKDSSDYLPDVTILDSPKGPPSFTLEDLGLKYRLLKSLERRSNQWTPHDPDFKLTKLSSGYLVKNTVRVQNMEKFVPTVLRREQLIADSEEVNLGLRYGDVMIDYWNECLSPSNQTGPCISERTWTAQVPTVGSGGPVIGPGLVPAQAHNHS